MKHFMFVEQHAAKKQRPKLPCEHWYPSDTWMSINGHKVCSDCFTDWKLKQFSKTASIQLNSHPHR